MEEPKGIWSQTQGRFLVVSSKANRCFLFHLGMQKAGESITLILTKTTTVTKHSHRQTTNSHLLFTLSET